jgi:hypothetical protein
MIVRRFAILALLFQAGTAMAQEYLLHTFEKIRLTDKFYAEGANYADFNQDGHMDVVYGPYWYEGPGFTVRHEIYPAQEFDPHSYSHNFFTFTYDLNGDGYPDVLVVGMPGEAAEWFENPGKNGSGMWQRHKVFDVVDNESPTFTDLLGTGKPVLVCTTGGRIGYAAPDWSAPAKPWTFHAISKQGTWQRYTHGLGVGDVNGDGRKDIMLHEGWWEQPASPAGDPEWTYHPADFGKGGSQMYAADLTGDGHPAVISSLVAHGYGLAWFQQKPDGDFIEHLIMGGKPEENAYGLVFSQLHALVVADMDGDGLSDIITGKRWWAHGPDKDAEPKSPAVLYWFKQVRDAKGVSFVPYLIDSDSGVGTQLVVGDLNGDGLPDIVVGNKKGGFVFIHHVAKVSQEEYERAQPKLRP